MEQCRRLAFCAILVACGWFTSSAIAADNVELYAQRSIMEDASISPDGTQVHGLPALSPPAPAAVFRASRLNHAIEFPVLYLIDRVSKSITLADTKIPGTRPGFRFLVAGA
jgi:hypothetical protein